MFTQVSLALYNQDFLSWCISNIVNEKNVFVLMALPSKMLVLRSWLGVKTENVSQADAFEVYCCTYNQKG